MSKGLVLISGVNGYIAAVTAKHFLDQGYSVRGTVRRRSSAQDLIDGPLKNYYESGTFEVVEVPDITIDGAFDEAVKGVTAIAHLATPVSFGFTDPEPVIHTAVNGTKTILYSAIKNAGPQLKTFVLMSSIVSIGIMGAQEGPKVFDEQDWNDGALKKVEELGNQTPGVVIYAASKTAGEKAFWEVKEQEKPRFTMSAINPVFVIGPSLIAPKTPADVGMTIQGIYHVFSGGDFTPSPIPFMSVDVRDVAAMLQYPIEHPQEADGERYITFSGQALHPPQATADILRKHFPSLRDVVREGNPGEGYNKDYRWEAEQGYSNNKASSALGRPWIDVETSVVDTVKVFEGLVQGAKI